MRDLDGCTYFLITDDGKKLLPNDLTVIPFSLMDGQRVLFTYKKAQNVAGICMAEDMIIDILSICIADKTTKPSKLQCIDMIDPVKTEWGRRLMNNQRVNKMWKFTYQDGFAYYFES
ncbi:MAG TPA: NigD-like N-terminal domain-containing protein, partial [Saprospiraceae bacterium]|nr:NigD-like N-terminal domain-containing protein [Saprospiraceae bacterium]